MIPNFEHIINLPEIKKYFDLLKTTPQTEYYHGEGDTYVHTLMVLEEIQKFFPYLDEEEKEISWWAALLHDIGKPQTSKIEDDGHVSARNHAKYGYHIALEILENFDIPFTKKLHILNLIRHHGKTQNLEEKKDIDRIAIQMSLNLSNKLLLMLGEADARGRICNDLDDMLFNIEMFREAAENTNCILQPYQFSSNIAKFNYLVKRTHHHSDSPYDDTKSKLYIMSGLMGTGKDYYITHNLKGIPVISLDDIREELKIKPTDEQGLVINTAKERTKIFLRKGEDVIWNATNVTGDMRKRLIEGFLPYNPYVKIIYINKPLKTILEQNRNRERQVPENVILDFYRKLEIPSQIEAHEVIFS